MATPKFTTFIIAIIWIGFFAGVFAPFIANTALNYNSLDKSSDIEIFNKLTVLNSTVSDIKDSTLDYEEKTGIADIVGDLFSSGYKTLKVMASSIDIFKTLLFGALKNSSLSIPAMEGLRTAAILTVTILLIIGVILKAITKSDV